MADDKHMTIDQAVAQVQRSVVVPKARYNAHGNYYYRSMEDIVAALKEPCRDAGVFFTLNDSIEQVGDRFYVKATCLVKFEDGTPGEIVICAYAREPLAQKGMSETQLTGSASSYARKYALCGMFDIDGTSDPDSLNGVEKPEKEPPAQGPFDAKCKALRHRLPLQQPRAVRAVHPEPRLLRDPDVDGLVGHARPVRRARAAFRPAHAGA